MLSQKMPNIFTDLTGSNLSQFFMGKISTGISHIKMKSIGGENSGKDFFIE